MLPTCEPYKELPQCTMGLSPRPPDTVAGFYFQDQWHSLVCNKINFPIPKALRKIRSCLKNHALYFWGDSTIRQWYEYFVDVLKLNERKGANVHFGPHVAVDKAGNISFHFHFHGYPARQGWTLVKDIHYVPNMIDDIKVNSGRIVILFT